MRDALATHILKQTGSYEQASYAIQDTADTVARHYGRFLPQDKAALAAEVLNKVWVQPRRLARYASGPRASAVHSDALQERQTFSASSRRQ